MFQVIEFAYTGQKELILNVIGDCGFTIGFVMHKAHNYIAT